MKTTSMLMTKSALLAAMGCVLSATTAQAAGFTSIRIGDVDGFGYGTGAGYTAANGSDVNVDGQGLLGNGDFLPDLNGNEIFATYQGDDFDHRGGNTTNFLTGSGFTDNGSSGSQYTDVSLSTSFLRPTASMRADRDLLRTTRDEKQARIDVLNDQIAPIAEQLAPLWAARKPFADERKVVKSRLDEIEAIKEEEGSLTAALRNEKQELIEYRKNTLNPQIKPWDDLIAPLNTEQFKAAKAEREGLQAERTAIQNEINTLNGQIETDEAAYSESLGGSKIPQPVFDFDFSVNKGDIKAGDPLYFNLLFADYDVKDAQIEFTTANGSFTRELTRQKNKEGFDGWVQSAFVELTFEEVFQAVGDDFKGDITAKVIANDEPYLAFDYAEISAAQISIGDDDSVEVPEPVATLGLLAFGALSSLSLKKRNQSIG
ncbi:MAG: hypothetical protein AAFZ17_14740 [Cyanobacteria bacterium J06650_10]